MDSKVARMAKRLEVLKLVSTVLMHSQPILAKKMMVLATNPGPSEHFQKVALELLAEAQKIPAMYVLTLTKAQNAMFNEDDIEGAIRLAQQIQGVANFI